MEPHWITGQILPGLRIIGTVIIIVQIGFNIVILPQEPQVKFYRTTDVHRGLSKWIMSSTPDYRSILVSEFLWGTQMVIMNVIQLTSIGGQCGLYLREQLSQLVHNLGQKCIDLYQCFTKQCLAK